MLPADVSIKSEKQGSTMSGISSFISKIILLLEKKSKTSDMVQSKQTNRINCKVTAMCALKAIMCATGDFIKGTFIKGPDILLMSEAVLPVLISEKGVYKPN